MNSVVNHTLQTALALPSAFGNNTDQRFDYLHKATIFSHGQQDCYSIQSPNAPAGTKSDTLGAALYRAGRLVKATSD